MNDRRVSDLLGLIPFKRIISVSITPLLIPTISKSQLGGVIHSPLIGLSYTWEGSIYGVPSLPPSPPPSFNLGYLQGIPSLHLIWIELILGGKDLFLWQDQVVQNLICFNLDIASSLLSSSTSKLRRSVTCWVELPSKKFLYINLRSLQPSQGAHPTPRVRDFSSSSCSVTKKDTCYSLLWCQPMLWCYPAVWCQPALWCQ